MIKFGLSGKLVVMAWCANVNRSAALNWQSSGRLFSRFFTLCLAKNFLDCTLSSSRHVVSELSKCCSTGISD